MSKVKSVINIRGGLGNQVIQAALGICTAKDKDPKTIKIHFNIAKPKHNMHIPHSWSKYYLNDLFANKFDYSVNTESTAKSKYWIHGAAEEIANKTNDLCAAFGIIPNEILNDESVVHIRTADKKTDNDILLYERMILKALYSSDKVRLIGDDQALIANFINKFKDFNVVTNEKSSVTSDWIAAFKAKVLCTPSSFAYSTKIFMLIRRSLFVVR